MTAYFRKISMMILAAAGLCCAADVAAGSDVRHLDGNTSLSNARITTVVADSRGLLWIGTASGLRRYDGYRMRLYREDHADGQSALNINITDIKEDALGRLWIKAEEKYRIYNPDTGELVEDAAAILSPRGIEGEISEVLSSSDGKMWIAVAGKGIYILDMMKDEGKADLTADGGLAASEVTALAESGNNVIAICRNGMLVIIDKNTGKLVKKTEIPANGNPNGPAEKDYALCADENGRLWIYHNEMLDAFDTKSGRWLSAEMPSPEETGVVKQVYEDHKGRLWIARDHRGLGELLNQDGRFRIADRSGAGSMLEGNTVTCLAETPDGTLWAGTYKQGMYYINSTVSKFHTERFPDVNCAMPAPDGTLWLGTDSNGLWHWNPADGSRHEVIDPADDGHPAAITSLAMDSDGTLYIGRFAKGLRKYKDGVFSSVTTGTPLDESFPWSLLIDKEGMLWVGTLGAGVYRINPAIMEVKEFRADSSGLSTDYVMSMEESNDGKIYFGTSYGISVYNSLGGKMESFLNEPDIPNPSSRVVTQVYEDSRGLLWIATQSGLKATDRIHGKIHDIATHGILTEAPVYGIIEDRAGVLWVAEGANLIRLNVEYDKKTGKLSVSPQIYDQLDGIQDSEFNSRSFAMLPDGDIVAGGLYGLTRFSPSGMRYNTHRPRVIFTDVYTDGKRVESGGESAGHAVLHKGLNQGATLEFGHDTKEFTVYFATDNYALPQKTVFEYRLLGYNDEWTAGAPGVNHVSYSNLSSGHYRLEVRAVNNDGFMSEAPAAIDIDIKPPLWASPWAFLIYAIALALVIYLIVHLVSIRERSRFERKRKEDTMRKQDEINQMKFKFFTNVSHDLRTPLTLIVSPLEAMLKESTDERQTKRLTIMRNNAMKLLALVNQLLDFRKTEMAGLQLYPSEGDIVAFARGVCSSFMSLSDRKNINLTFYSSAEKIEFAFDSDKMEKILMNLLGNSFKFTPAGGRVDVSIEALDGETVRIKVADTGPGISDKDKPHIFERFYQVDDNGEAHPGMGSGIGLSMVSEYVRLHNGSVRVADNVECGSVFIIELPMRHGGNEKKSPEPEREVSPTGNNSESKNVGENGKKPIMPTKPAALVVDDNPDITELIKDGVEDDFDVVTAADGRDALEKLKTVTPAIIVADLMMPGINGMELCRRLKSDNATARIPLIILTAKHDLAAKVEGLTSGADDYMTKPFNIDVLRLRMKKLVQLSGKGTRGSHIEPMPEDIKITPLDEKFIAKAMKYVSDNIDRPDLSVEELSGKLGMSRVRLYKKIKHITGKTPIEFIRVIRLKRAAQLLRESQLNVSEIAYQTGFNSPKVFSKYFKEEFGILPSRYQEKEERETNYTI